MPLLGLILTLTLALADWLTIIYGWRRLRRLTKPAVMVALFAWVLQAGGASPALHWFQAAIVFSLLGDIFLLMSSRYFLDGLAAFLVAHILYIIGFNQSPLPAFSWGAALLAVGVALAGALIYTQIRRGLNQRSYGRKMRGAVLTYCLAICGMAFSAGMTLLRPDWGSPAVPLACGGALLFMASDSMLGYDRFVQPIRNGRLWVRITYHLGQAALVAAALLHYRGM